MSIKRLLPWLLAAGCAYANNGRELSPKGFPFAKLVTTRTDPNGAKRRGVCSATFVTSKTHTGLLTAAHCLTPPAEVIRFREEHAAELLPFRDRTRRNFSLQALRALVRESNPLADALRDRLESLRAYTTYDVQWGGGEVAATRGRWHVHPLYVMGLLLEEQSQDVLYDLAYWIPDHELRGVPSIPIVSNTATLTSLGLFGFGDQWDRIQPAAGDYDHDGVSNALDLCPTTPRGAAVNAVGCALNDPQLSHAFRGGQHEEGGRYLALKGSYWFGLGVKEFPEAIQIEASPLLWQDVSNTMPGKGDSGSGLVRLSTDGTPEALRGVYHGPLGPRYEAEQGLLSMKARYENVAHPLVQDWLAGWN